MPVNKAITGVDVICKDCKLYRTDKCIKWEYWEKVSHGYALHIMSYPDPWGGECISKEVKPSLQGIV
ncbi:MAG: hypothetical protein FWD87_11070 [Spirochaetaceae bacterium]|nr:hypothetical protein [Spirochaetaceae bacterium]